MADTSKVDVRNLDLFELLCNKIACLVYSRTDGDKKALNQVLGALNGLDYNLLCVQKERGILLINQCCYIIPPEETYLASKAINLFTSLITKGQVTVEGKTLSLSVNWCLECMKHGNQIIALKCLQELVKGNGKKIEHDCNQMLNDLEKISNKFTVTSGNEEVFLNCLRCVEAISFLADTTEKLPTHIIGRYFEIFKDVLFKEKNKFSINEIIYCKCLITAMRGIENLIQNSVEICNSELGNILGIIKSYMLYGLPDFNNYKVEKILPSSATIPEVLKSFSQSVRKLRGKYDKRPKKVVLSSINAVEEEDSNTTNSYIGYAENIYQTDSSMVFYKTSDSDFSDSEFSQNIKIKSYKGKVRHCALILMGTVIQKTDPKVFIAYLPSFLPDGSKFHVRTLITCLLKDPFAKSRCEVLGVLLTIISNSRQYFLQADGISKSSFIAFSCTISNIIKELHRGLILNLISEDNNTAIKRSLKCISDLIRCSPYHKMESGLITEISDHVRSFLKHKDVNVQIFALTVFGCLVSVEPKIQELRKVIITSNIESLKNEFLISDKSVKDFEIHDEEVLNIVKEKPWLFDLCLQNLEDKNKHCDSSTNVALQVESLHVIGALVRNFFNETLVSFPMEIIDLLKHCSSKSEYSIRLSSGKLMETVLNSLQFSFCQEDETKTASVQLVTLLWEALLPGPITTLIQSIEEPMLRSTGCDCIANVGVQVQNGQIPAVQNSLIFDQLPRNKQIMCITLLFGCVRDESPAVRSSASRTLAFFVMFLSLREDSLFFLDAIDATLYLAKDKNTTVRTQASWLFGNLSEAVALNTRDHIADDLPLDVLAELLKTGIALSGDSPKVRPGAVRGIGNFLQIANEEFMTKYKDLVLNGIEVLIKNATTGTFMKARWNSCYAIANILQNPLISSNNEWMTKIFNVMTSLVQHYKNFKVRISAGFVLGVPASRNCYGELYNFVWSGVLNALENSKNIADFNEYQHRDQLVDQLCLVVCHLISLMEPSDLNSLQDILYFHLDDLNHFMAKFKERIIPEKSDILLNATEKINSLMHQKCLTTEEKSVIKVLNNFFIYEY